MNIFLLLHRGFLRLHYFLRETCPSHPCSPCTPDAFLSPDCSVSPPPLPGGTWYLQLRGSGREAVSRGQQEGCVHAVLALPSPAEAPSCAGFLCQSRCLLHGVSVGSEQASVCCSFPQLFEVCVTMQLVSHAQISHGGDLFLSTESPAWVRTMWGWHQLVSVLAGATGDFCLLCPGVRLRLAGQAGHTSNLMTFCRDQRLHHSQLRMGPAHPGCPSTGQTLNRLPVITDLCWATPPMRGKPQVLLKPPTKAFGWALHWGW